MFLGFVTGDANEPIALVLAPGQMTLISLTVYCMSDTILNLFTIIYIYIYIHYYKYIYIYILPS